MKFIQIKKRKILKTWQNKNRKLGLVSFIYCNPNGDYYFAISCFEKRCGLQKCIDNKEDCDMYVFYNSLDEGLVYENFDECVEAVIQWYKVWG